MSRRVDHAFKNPRVHVANLGFAGRQPVQFGVCAEEGDGGLVAKICFCSYMVGPGVKIILRGGDHPS